MLECAVAPNIDDAQAGMGFVMRALPPAAADRTFGDVGGAHVFQTLVLMEMAGQDQADQSHEDERGELECDVSALRHEPILAASSAGRRRI